jgi:transposase
VSLSAGGNGIPRGHEGIASNLYYRWSKDFLEAGKKQLAGDTVREATSDEVKELRAENRELKEVVASI